MMRLSRREAAYPENINLSEWIQDFVSEFITQKQLQKADINIKGTSKNIDVRIDVSQLYQVVWNLSENALRYSQKQPLIEYNWGTRAGTGKPYLDVIDRGPGMTEEVASQVFEPFFTTDEGGSGLGLYISRELCEANQASLILKTSAEGKQGKAEAKRKRSSLPLDLD